MKRHTIDRAGRPYVAACMVALAACGGGGDLSVNIPQLAVNSPPLADPGPDRFVEPGVTVSLDGTGSIDPNGDPLNHRWALTQRPPGSVAALSTDSGPSSSFIADLPGVYIAALVVDDGQSRSAVANVSITARSTQQAPSPAPAPVPPPDPGAPRLASIAALADDLPPATGDVANDGTSNDLTPTLRGTVGTPLATGERVLLFRDGREVGEATVDGTRWTFTDSLSAYASHAYSAAVHSASAGLGPASAAFRVRFAPPRYRIQELPLPAADCTGGCSTTVTRINRNGVAIGNVMPDGGGPYPPGVLWDEISRPVRDTYELAWAKWLSDSGHVVGGGSYKFLRNGFVWREDSGIRLIPRLAGDDFNSATGVNNFGQVVGDSYVFGDGTRRAYVWAPDTGTVALPVASAADSSVARAVNDARRIAGAVFRIETSPRAVVWDPGRAPREIGFLPGDDTSTAIGINSAGIVLGRSGRQSGGATRHFLWIEDRGLVELPSLPGATSCTADSIDDHGVVFGHCDPAGPVVWVNRRPFPVRDLVSASDPLRDRHVIGSIVGQDARGRIAANTGSRAVLLVPE